MQLTFQLFPTTNFWCWLNFY